MLSGSLFKYGPRSANVAFKHGTHPRHVLVVGGLTDGLFATRWVEPLSRALESEGGVSVVQVLLSSSHSGYGTSSLDQDAEELEELVRFLQAEAEADYGIVGHSTGCQDAVRFCRRILRAQSVPKPSFVILQAPVSDRESLALTSQTTKNIDLARELMTKSQGEEVLMPLSTQEDGSPITARRYLSLAAKGGDDDMFSSDLKDAELDTLLGHMAGIPTLVLQSGADEYVFPVSPPPPPSLSLLADTALSLLLCRYIPHVTVDATSNAERLAKAMGGEHDTATAVTIDGGSHALEDHTEVAVQTIQAFMRDVNFM